MTPELIKLLDELEDARLMADTHHTSVGGALGKAIDWIQNSETVVAIRPDPKRAAFMLGDEGGGMATFYFRHASDGQKWFEAILAVAPPQAQSDVTDWIRNNYQDYPTIDSLCEALDAAINTSKTS